LITNAAITPGTHPTKVNMTVINIDPHPLSKTASGGKMTHRITRQILIPNLPFKKKLNKLSAIHIRNYNHIVS